MSILAKPDNIYKGEPIPAGVLPQARVDVGNSAVFVLSCEGADGLLTIQSTLASLDHWTDLVYSLTLDGPAVTGVIPFTDGTRIYVRGPLSFIQINGTVTAGALTLMYFGSPFPVDGPVQISMDADLDAITAALNALASGIQRTQLMVGLDEVGPLVPLPVSFTDPVQIGGPVQALVQSLNGPGSMLQLGAGAIGPGILYPTAGMSGVVVQLAVSATATVTWEVFVQDQQWNSVIALNIATGVTAVTATATGLYWVPTAGMVALRARVSAYSSGFVNAFGMGYYGAPPYTITLLAQSIAGEDLTNNRIKTEDGYSVGTAAAAATTVIKSGAGLLQRIIFPTNVASGTAKIYDNTAASGTVLLDTVTVPSTITGVDPFVLELGVAFATGCTVVMTGTNFVADVVYA